MNWISNLFSSSKKSTPAAVAQESVGEQQGRKVNQKTGELPVAPAAAGVSDLDLSERKVEQKAPESKMEQLAKLLASMSPEERAAFAPVLGQSIKNDHDQKNQEFASFLETFNAPRTWVSLEKLLVGVRVREACQDKNPHE